MSRRCNRCDWKPTGDTPPAAQAAEHADESGHPRCAICTRSLAWEESQTCGTCAATTRAHLDEIADVYVLLPAELANLPSPAPRDQTAPSAEPTFPGGDALVMLAGGNSNVGSPNPGEPLGVYSRADDPPSVLAELASWEADWREIRAEPATAPATVTEVVSYLAGRNLAWAASHHPAFDEFAGDVRKLRARLLAVTSTSRTPLHGPRCLDCDAALERGYRAPLRCGHVRPTNARLPVLHLDGNGEPTTRPETVRERDHRLARWTAEHNRCRQGGLDDEWTCPRCGRMYTDEAFWLAFRAELAERKRRREEGA